MRRLAAIGFVLSASVIVTASTLLAQDGVTTVPDTAADAPATRPADGRGGRDHRGDGGHDGQRDGMRDDSRDRDGDRDGERDGPMFGRRGGGGDRWLEQPQPNEEEWETIEAFMRENSPARFAMYLKIEAALGVERRATQAVRLRIASRYREVQRLRERNADLHDFALKQLRIEDAALATLADLRRDGDSAALEAKLDAQMRGFVDNALAERTARLEKLRTFLAKEESAIARDRANVDALVARQRERFEKEMEKMLDFSARFDDRNPATQPAGYGR